MPGQQRPSGDELSAGGQLGRAARAEEARAESGLTPLDLRARERRDPQRSPILPSEEKNPRTHQPGERKEKEKQSLESNWT